MIIKKKRDFYVFKLNVERQTLFVLFVRCIIENELDELLKDEDGDIILNEQPDPKGIVLTLKKNKLLNNNLTFETIYRDEKGRQIDKSETKQAKKKDLEKRNHDNLNKFAKGIKQEEEKRLKREEYIKSKNEPLNRLDIDESYDNEMKARSRFEDPLKGTILSKNLGKGINTNGISGDKNIFRGFYLPNCKYSAPVNRFSIAAGYRWDGVVRGNGFEKRFLENINIKKAREEEYHKIRTEEM